MADHDRMSISQSGTIQNTPLADILEDLRTKRFSGTLVVRRENVSKNIYLKEGQIVFASSTEMRDRLGETLVRLGKISPEQLDKALLQYNKHAGIKKFGSILVENGTIPPKELFNGLKLQVREIIISLFLWSEGEYRIEASLPADVIALQIDFQSLIREVIEKIRQQA
jgi:Domain of unknown function (DUF4388)